jgi:hypothetical protein
MGDFWVLFLISVGKIAFLSVPKVGPDVVRLRSGLDVEDLFHDRLQIRFREVANALTFCRIRRVCKVMSTMRAKNATMLP